MRETYARITNAAIAITDFGFLKKMDNGLPGVPVGLRVVIIVDANYSLYCIYHETESGLYCFDKAATIANCNLGICIEWIEAILAYVDLSDRTEEDYNCDRLTNCFDFDASGYDRNGFDSWRIHRDTGTTFNPKGFDMDGFGSNGLNRRGYDCKGFSSKGIHKKTRTKYAPDGYDKMGLDINGECEKFPF